MSALGMPAQILSLFAPRLPLQYMKPMGGYGNKPNYTGLKDYVSLFETTPPPPVPSFETPQERRDRKKKEKIEEHKQKQQELIKEYDPKNAECATKNPYATLFVGRISYETTEKKLKKEFETFGPIRRVKIITDFAGKSRGYAFIEYENESDLKTAYKQGDGKKIDGRRVIVDVERSRTVSGWLPRRLGGGKGPPRFSEPKKKGKQVVAPPSIGHTPRGNNWPNNHIRSTRGRPGFRGQDNRRVSSSDWNASKGGNNNNNTDGRYNGGRSYGGGHFDRRGDDRSGGHNSRDYDNRRRSRSPRDRHRRKRSSDNRR